MTVFTTDANGRDRLDHPRSVPIQVDGVEVWYFQRICSRIAPSFFYSPELGKKCDAAAATFDGIYISATWTYPILVGARAAHRSGVPYIVSPRGSFMHWSMSQKALKKQIYLKCFERGVIENAHAIHCTSRLEADQTRTHGFPTPMVVVPNPVQTPPRGSLESARVFRRQLGIPEEGSLTIFTGRKHPMKRLDLTIQSFALVSQRLPSAHLAIVGPDDGVEADLRRQIDQLEMADQVHLIGLLEGEDLGTVYSAANLLVMLSQRENFGMAAAEALAFGIPVLLSKDVGLAFEVAAAGAGKVVRPNLPEIANAWLSMLTECDLGEMGKAGRDFVMRELTPASVGRQMLRAFNESIRLEGVG